MVGEKRVFFIFNLECVHCSVVCLFVFQYTIFVLRLGFINDVDMGAGGGCFWMLFFFFHK